jgi:hypothetical protein
MKKDINNKNVPSIFLLINIPKMDNAKDTIIIIKIEETEEVATEEEEAAIETKGITEEAGIIIIEAVIEITETVVTEATEEVDTAEIETMEIMKMEETIGITEEVIIIITKIEGNEEITKEGNIKDPVNNLVVLVFMCIAKEEILKYIAGRAE